MAGAGAKQDEFMKPAAMKLLLNNADRKPLPCCIGEGDEPIMMVEKIGKPKKLLSDMLADAQKRKTPIDRSTARFGMATLDPADTSTIKVMVNKPVKPSIQVSLRKMVKTIGFKEIIFLVDDALENDTDEEGAGTATPTAARPPPPPPPQRDARMLTAELAKLIGQMKTLTGVDPGYLARLNGLAAATGAAIKAPDLAQAEVNLKSMEELLASPVPAPPSMPGTAGPSTVASVESCGKARDAWLMTRKRLEDGIAGLRKVILETYPDGTLNTQLETAFEDRVGPVLQTMDDRLAEKLDEAAKTQDASARGQLMAEAQALMKEYMDYVGKTGIVADLDKNPFVPLAIQETVTKTLGALSKMH